MSKSGQWQVTAYFIGRIFSVKSVLVRAWNVEIHSQVKVNY